MLQKINRLRNKKEFDLVFKEGRGFKNSSLILRVVKNDLNYSRVGIIVSQKVSKKAVERNKIRRRISEVLRSEFKNIKEGLDLVFILLPGSRQKTFFDIKVDVISAIKKSVY